MIADEALEILEHISPFDALPHSELERLAASATELNAVQGQMILREGERGDQMYLLTKGSVQVLGQAFDGSEVVLARLEAGQYFGEQALLRSGRAKRNASIRALTRCRLLALTREGLLHALDQSGEFARKLDEAGNAQQALKQSRLREDVLRNIGATEGYRMERYPPGNVVFEQGEPADRLFLILAGSAMVSRVQDGEVVKLAELLPGQFFGELAILNDQPRAATVRAVEPLEVASLDATWFRATLESQPQLKSIMSSLQSMYMLPTRGLLTLQTGKLSSRPTLTAIHDLPDGRRVISTRMVGAASFTSRVVGAAEAEASARYSDPDDYDISREIQVAEGKIIELESSGEWRQLGEVLAMLLDGTAVTAADLERFEAQGSFAEEGGPIKRKQGFVCTCASVTAATIEEAVISGCTTAEQVTARTRASLVCGGCLPVVKEMLGQSDWVPARLEAIERLNDNIRAFLIKPMDRGLLSFFAGQHLVVQARIDDHWVLRPYTISSAPTATGEGYEITVKREPEGVFSRWLFEREPRDTLLRISSPAGSFCLPEDPATDIVCFVAGIGVTPALAMARSMAAQPRPGRLFVDYSVSVEGEAICRSELEAIAQQNPKVALNLRVTSVKGRLGIGEVEAIAQQYPAGEYYLCGSNPYMDAVVKLLDQARIPAKRIHRELFTIAGEQPAA